MLNIFIALLKASVLSHCGHSDFFRPLRAAEPSPNDFFSVSVSQVLIAPERGTFGRQFIEHFPSGVFDNI
jgi:hypothetical protein